MRFVCLIANIGTSWAEHGPNLCVCVCVFDNGFRVGNA